MAGRSPVSPTGMASNPSRPSTGDPYWCRYCCTRQRLRARSADLAVRPRNRRRPAGLVVGSGRSRITLGMPAFRTTVPSTFCITHFFSARFPGEDGFICLRFSGLHARDYRGKPKHRSPVQSVQADGVSFDLDSVSGCSADDLYYQFSSVRAVAQTNASGLNSAAWDRTRKAAFDQFAARPMS